MIEAVANNDLQTALLELIQLDYDAIATYTTAIDHIINKDYQAMLSTFKSDHEQHIKDIGDLLLAREIILPNGPDFKSYLSKATVLLGDLFSDKAVLLALLNSETPIYDAYNTANQVEDIWLDFIELLAKALSDEVRHKKWLEDQLASI